LTFYPSSFPLSFSRHGNLTPNSPNGISPFSFGELPSIQRLKLLAIRRPREDRKKKEEKKKGRGEKITLLVVLNKIAPLCEIIYSSKIKIRCY